jgi:hypothetical protein
MYYGDSVDISTRNYINRIPVCFLIASILPLQCYTKKVQTSIFYYTVYSGDVYKITWNCENLVSEVTTSIKCGSCIGYEEDEYQTE